MEELIAIAGLLLVAVGFIFKSIVTVRQTERGVKERFGKFRCFYNPGFHLRIPIIEKIYIVNVTEQLVDAQQQEVITKDNLNATVDAQVYFKVKNDEDSVFKSFYNVNNVEQQIVALARTTLRNVIGTMPFIEVNSNRSKINRDLFDTLSDETKSWGIQIVRTELKEIKPPEDVQETMNKVLKAQNEKTSAIDFATARETEADGYKRAKIKQAEGEKKATILQAEGNKEATILRATGEAERIKLVNESAQKYFKNQAVLLKKLDVTQNAFENNTKIIIPQGSSIVNVMSDAGSIPRIKCEEKIIPIEVQVKHEKDDLEKQDAEPASSPTTRSRRMRR